MGRGDPCATQAAYGRRVNEKRGADYRTAGLCEGGDPVLKAAHELGWMVFVIAIAAVEYYFGIWLCTTAEVSKDAERCLSFFEKLDGMGGMVGGCFAEKSAWRCYCAFMLMLGYSEHD